MSDYQLITHAKELLQERGFISATELAMHVTEKACELKAKGVGIEFGYNELEALFNDLLSDRRFRRQEYCTQATEDYRTKELYYYWPP